MGKSAGIIFLMFIVTCKLASQVSFTLSNNVCSGSTKTVSANTGTDTPISYTWTSNPQIPSFSYPYSQTTSIYFPSSGTYTIILNATLVGGSVNYSNVITVNSTPTITIAQSSPTTCATYPVTLLASGADSYTWSANVPPSLTGGVDHTRIVRPAVSDCYTVTGSIANCTSSAISCITVYDCTGIHSNSLDSIGFSFYPNPFKNMLYIEFIQNKIEDDKIIITNNLGQVIYTLDELNSKQEIDLSFLTNGVYFLKIQNGDDKKVFKIIKAD